MVDYTKPSIAIYDPITGKFQGRDSSYDVYLGAFYTEQDLNLVHQLRRFKDGGKNMQEIFLDIKSLICNTD